jgi:DNA-binding MltR family transcriptional regulator
MGHLTIYVLEKVQESQEISSFDKKVNDLLLAAINDWPNPIFGLSEYELVVSDFIRGETTPMKIKVALSKINYLKESWQAESLSQIDKLLALFNNRLTLNEVIDDLELKFGEGKQLMGNLTIYVLEKVKDSPEINSFDKKIVDLLLAAINDWPNPIFGLSEYELVVSDFIRGETTPLRIKGALSKINYLKESWQAESLSQIDKLLALFNNRLTLKEVIDDLELKFGEV